MTRITFKPSKYQKAIYSFIKKEKGNAIVQAVAGSGKTTTIVEATKLLPSNSRSLFVAFNKSIANELRKRLPRHIEARTLHSLGLSMFYGNTNSRPELDSGKLEDTIVRVLQESNLSDRMFDRYFFMLKKMVPLVKAILIEDTKFEKLEDLKIRFNMEHEIDELFITLLNTVLKSCKENIAVIDYDDMIWIPIVNKFKVKTYDWVFVDETQDLNPIQFELIKKVCNPKTRIIAVGDRRQSIYAFRGADTQSMDNFKDYFKAEELPLSICYRCGKSIVKLAKEIVPEIETFETADDGFVELTDEANIVQIALDDDLILCRTNAPLIQMAFSLIRHGKKAVVRGRDIGKNLIKMVDKYSVTNLNDLLMKINNFRRLQMEKLDLIERGQYDKRKKNQLMMAVDSCDTISVIADNVGTIEALKTKIGEIFTDEKTGIVCSSIHKAKGLEAERVFIIQFDNMPHPMATTPEEIDQEWNIKYVAITRAKKQLYLANSEG